MIICAREEVQQLQAQRCYRRPWRWQRKRHSPESNGMAEAFVNTIKRDYVPGADLSDAETVIRQLTA